MVKYRFPPVTAPRLVLPHIRSSVKAGESATVWNRALAMGETIAAVHFSPVLVGTQVAGAPRWARSAALCAWKSWNRSVGPWAQPLASSKTATAAAPRALAMMRSWRAERARKPPTRMPAAPPSR